MGESHLLDDEHFVPVKDYERYEVSNLGRVVNAATGKDLTIREGKEGDRYVVLYSINKNPVQIPVRVLVAQAFFVDYRPSREVFLKSTDKSDCSVMNVTLNVPPRARTKIDHKRQIRINELNEVFDTPSQVAKRIHGESGIVAKILMGLGKTHRGYSFSYVD